MISIGQEKVSNLPAKLCAFGPKEKKILKNFKKILIFFDQNLYGIWTFSQFFTKYFLEFCLLSESIDPWKITPDFTTNFPISGGGGTFRTFLYTPDATALLFKIRQCAYRIVLLLVSQILC